MKKQLKKNNGNKNAIFRKITITNTVLTYIILVLAFAAFVFSILICIAVSQDTPDLQSIGSKREIVIILALVGGIIALILIGAFALAITQGVLSKKVGMIGNKIHPQIVPILLITFVVLAIFGALLGSFVMVFVVEMEPGTEHFEELNHLRLLAAAMSTLLFCASTIFALVPSVFNTILCKNLKK